MTNPLAGPVPLGDLIDFLRARGLIEIITRPHPTPGMVYPFTVYRFSITEAGRRLIEALPPRPDLSSPSPLGIEPTG